MKALLREKLGIAAPKAKLSAVSVSAKEPTPPHHTAATTMRPLARRRLAARG